MLKHIDKLRRSVRVSTPAHDCLHYTSHGLAVVNWEGTWDVALVNKVCRSIKSVVRTSIPFAPPVTVAHIASIKHHGLFSTAVINHCSSEAAMCMLSYHSSQEQLIPAVGKKCCIEYLGGTVGSKVKDFLLTIVLDNQLSSGVLCR